MQLATITSLFAVALGAIASPLDIRAPPSVFGRFYNLHNGCNTGLTGTPIEFEQSATVGSAGCRNVTTTPEETFFYQNTLTRTLVFYNMPCGRHNEGQNIQVTPTTTGCQYLQNGIKSYETV